MVALCLLVILFSIQSTFAQGAPDPAPANYGDEGKETKEGDPSRAPEQPVIIDVPESAVPPGTVSEQQNGSRDTKPDSHLDQDPRITWSAIASASAAVFGLGLGIWSIHLLRKNLAVSHQLVRQDRAFITIDKVTHGIEGETDNVVVTWHIKNTGNTIANNIRYQAGLDIRPIVNPHLADINPVPVDAHVMWINPMTAGQQETAPVHIRTALLFPIVDDTDLGGVFKIVINYADIYGDARSTEHVAQLRFRGNGAGFKAGVFYDPGFGTVAGFFEMDPYIAGQYVVR